MILIAILLQFNLVNKLMLVCHFLNFVNYFSDALYAVSCWLMGLGTNGMMGFGENVEDRESEGKIER